MGWAPVTHSLTSRANEDKLMLQMAVYTGRKLDNPEDTSAIPGAQIDQYDMAFHFDLSTGGFLTVYTLHK